MESATRTRDLFVRHEFGSDRLDLETAKLEPRLPVIGILDNLRSAHNVGSAFRTGDGAGIGALWLCGICPTPPHRHLAKTALGAVESVPWQSFPTTSSAIAQAKQAGMKVVALELCEESTSIWQTELQFPLALVVGNEVQGLSWETRRMCDATVHLPMFGHKNSLNVSVAFGVALYEIMRQMPPEMRKIGAAR